MGKRDVLTWLEYDKKLYRWESQNKAARITAIYFDGDDAPAHYSGMNSECDVFTGKPSVRLSSGDIIEI